jgi:hypothetical protein
MAVRNVFRVALGTTLLVLVGMEGRARAEVHVSIQYDSEQRVELARRLVSELESDGYTVEISAQPVSSPCEAKGGAPIVSGDTRAWIRIGAAPDGSENAVVTICYLGSVPFLQQALASAPGSDPRQLAVVTAEALNGLRSKVSPAKATVAVPERQESSPGAPPEPSRFRGPVNSLELGAGVLGNAPDYPAAPVVVLRANLGIDSAAGLWIDAVVPTSGADLTGAQMTATVRTGWMRVGPRVGGAVGDFELSGALLAGAAITWATAVATPPRIGTADVSPSAVFSLAAALEYPRRSTLFACASASASALLPGLRVDLGNGDAPLGAWPLEAAIALGARWGER